jgi:multidrug resistance efflux pump
MAKGRYSIKGTKDFLVAAVFCGFLCVWSIRDAWFPTEKVMKKHPHEIQVAFKVPGVLKEIAVQPGDEVNGKMLLASLYDDSYRAKVETDEAAFEKARDAKDPFAEEKMDELRKARADVAACTLYNTDITWMSAHGEESLRGVVSQILAETATHIDVGTPVMTIKPTDSFYAFNKTLAVLSFVGMIAALIFHRIAS